MDDIDTQRDSVVRLDLDNILLHMVHSYDKQYVNKDTFHDTHDLFELCPYTHTHNIWRYNGLETVLFGIIARVA